MTWACYDEFYFSVTFTSLSLYIQQFWVWIKNYMSSILNDSKILEELNTHINNIFIIIASIV